MSTRRQFLAEGAGALGSIALAGRAARGQAQEITSEGLVAKAVAYLKPRQGADGGWSTGAEPGITALVLTALLRSGRVATNEPEVGRALAYLEKFVGDDGGFSKAAHANYTTAIALIAFRQADAGTGKYKALIGGGQAFLKTMQWDEGEGKTRSDAFYGGAGYGGNNSRPDLSNTTFFIEALRESGLPADDPGLQKALIFVSRSQNLKGEFNDQPWADKVNDGGFIYTPANGGTSVAGKDDAGGLRSYASMTYAGLKSMIYAGLTPDDPRVKAASAYIGAHYSLDENPGLGQSGLYYYYQTFAKALAMVGKPTLVDASGQSHDWRADLVGALGRRQQADGGWVNKDNRFLEGDPNLSTAYALLALIYARPAKA